MRWEQLFVHLCICAFVWPKSPIKPPEKNKYTKDTIWWNCSTRLICVFVYLCIHQQNHSLTECVLVYLTRTKIYFSLPRFFSSTWFIFVYLTLRVNTFWWPYYFVDILFMHLTSKHVVPSHFAIWLLHLCHRPWYRREGYPDYGASSWGQTLE